MIAVWNKEDGKFKMLTGDGEDEVQEATGSSKENEDDDEEEDEMSE